MDFGSSSRFPVENHHRYHHHHQYYGLESSSNTSRDLEQQQQQQEDQEMESNSVFVEREHMFDKVVTPSDVGKLNRLVIPKQHAEKYFPLDSSSNEKGLLLNFEDRCGKLWRFRYSYWTSSQSYVMTKGWSRFVKEKRLDAGDIVSFQRPRLPDNNLPKDRFFIDWRRRPSHPPHLDTTTTPLHFHHHAALSPQIPHHFHLHHWNNPLPTPLSLRRDHLGLHLPQNNTNHTTSVSLFHNNNPYRNNNTYYHHHNHPIVAGSGGDSSYGGASVFYHLRSPIAAAPPQEALPVVAGGSGGGGGSHGIGKAAAAGKTLRLFGVNMECAVSEESDDECDISTSTTTMSSPQFRIYNGTPMSMPMPMPTNNTNYTPTTDFFERGKSSMSSLDFGTS